MPNCKYIHLLHCSITKFRLVFFCCFSLRRERWIVHVITVQVHDWARCVANVESNISYLQSSTVLILHLFTTQSSKFAQTPVAPYSDDQTAFGLAIHAWRVSMENWPFLQKRKVRRFFNTKAIEYHIHPKAILV